MRVLLVQPPYLRLYGSHNDRVPLELCYLRTYLQNAGFESIVFNADWTGATAYIEWRRLFSNSNLAEVAIDGRSSMFDETIERIVSLEPDICVLAAGDSLTPWVDLGNAYFTADLSSRLRRLGLYTIGVGPFYAQVPDRFSTSFDVVLIGAASPTISQIARERPRNRIIHGSDSDLSILPSVEGVLPAGRADVVLTAAGCAFGCTFCMAQETKYQPIAVATVYADVAGRSASMLDIGDAVFPLASTRLRELTSVLRHLRKTYTCEATALSLTDDRVSVLKELGVGAVKIGLETADDQVLQAVRKPHNVEDVRRAVATLRRYEIKVIAYVLLGGPSATRAAAAATLRLCQELSFDDIVVNVWAHHDLKQRDFRYDAHFSLRLARAWGVEDLLEPFFRLQASSKIGLGPLIKSTDDARAVADDDLCAVVDECSSKNLPAE